MATNNFINECKNMAYRNRYGKFILSDNVTELNQSNKIQNFTIDSGCYDSGNIIGVVYCKKLTANLIDSLNTSLIDESINSQVGVKYSNNTTEYVNMGKFKIERPKDELLDNFTSLTAYDSLQDNIDKEYICGLDYESGNITLSDLYSDVCSQLELIPKTLVFTNSTIPISSNPFTNKEKNRTVLQTICKISCSFVEIDLDNDKIDLSWLSDSVNPDYTFQKNDYSDLKGGKIVYGPINTLIIKNSTIDDENVSISDDESIALYGEHQLIISEDYILYNSTLREQAINSIWSKVHNLTYVDCELTSYCGKPFLKIGSKIRIMTGTNLYIDTYVLQHLFTYDGSFKSVIKSPALTQQEIKNKQNIGLGEKLRQAEVTINKQEGEIVELTGRVNETDSTLNQVKTSQNNVERKIEILSSNIDEEGNVTEVTTTTGFTFNASGLHIAGEGFEAQHTSTGTYYKDGTEVTGQYTKDGSKQKDLELFGTYSYGKTNLNDTPMFVAQLYRDENGEECFGHFSNRS